MIRYAITDGRAGEDGPEVIQAQAARWAEAEIEYVQLREKTLAAGRLAELGRRLLRAFEQAGGKTKLLVNSRLDVAVAIGAAGVHLTAAEGELTAEQVREVYRQAGRGSPVVSVSCHSEEDVVRAVRQGVDLVLFGPVFGKIVEGAEVVAGIGVEELRRACRAAGQAKVLALGGVTERNMAACREAGAAGVAGIRLFGG